MKRSVTFFLLVAIFMASCEKKELVVQQFSLSPVAGANDVGTRFSEVVFDKAFFYFNENDSSCLLTWKSMDAFYSLKQSSSDLQLCVSGINKQSIFSNGAVDSVLKQYFQSPTTLIRWIADKPWLQVQSPILSLATCDTEVKFNVGRMQDQPFDKSAFVDHAMMEKNIRDDQPGGPYIHVYGNLKNYFDNRQIAYAPLIVHSQGMPDRTFFSGCNGSYDVRLPSGYEYSFVFGGKYFVEKIVVIDSKSVANDSAGFDMNLDGTLFEKQAQGNFDFLSEPIAIARYDSTEDMLAFDFEYSKERMERLETELAKNVTP